MTLLKWLAEGLGYDVAPIAVFYVLRAQMFLLSFVLEDWALHELLPVKRERAVALLLVASSYVTWTFQMHTFSNSLETILVLWCLVLMRRMREDQEHTQVKLCVALAFLGVLGIFNRITFPAFLLVSGTQLLPELAVTPWRLPVILLAGGLTALIAVSMDTEYFTGSKLNFSSLFEQGVLTPYNNVIYNLDATNLAQHGLHPFWQHFVVNLPQLLGPAVPLLLFVSRKNSLFWSGVAGIAVLSCFRHQEPRFLLPAVPLLLASVRLPRSPQAMKMWTGFWVIFNLLAAIVFGLYHQAGVVPMQDWIRQQPHVTQTLWWKTYSPPLWLLGHQNDVMSTTDLMGMAGPRLIEQLSAIAPCQGSGNDTFLVAPSSAMFLDQYTLSTTEGQHDLVFQHKCQHRQHLGLDDLDFGEDGFVPTLQRVIGRRGLDVWQISRLCS